MSAKESLLSFALKSDVTRDWIGDTSRDDPGGARSPVRTQCGPPRFRRSGLFFKSRTRWEL